MRKATICLFFLLFSSLSFGDTVSYETGVQLRKAGQYPAAEHVFLKLLKKDPNNAELWYQFGVTLRFQSKRGQAMNAQRQALKLAQDNNDIKIEIARLHYWNQNYAAAEHLVNTILLASPNYIEAQQLSQSLARAKSAPLSTKKHYRWQLDTNLEHSSFSRQERPEWRKSHMRIGYWLDDQTLAHLQIERHRRDTVYNNHFKLGVARQFGKNYNLQFDLGHTASPIYLPRWQTKLAGEARLGNSRFWLTGHIQHARYNALKATVIKPGLRINLFDTTQLHTQYVNVYDSAQQKHLSGGSARIDWRSPLPSLRFFGGYANAPESENYGTVRTQSWFGGLAYTIMPALTLHAAYARNDREESYIRNVLTVALSTRF